MFRALQVFSFVAAVCFVSSQVDAADPFRATSSHSTVSTSSLTAMGLGGMQTMSQNDATQVRGQGARAWGTSFAGSQASFNFGPWSNSQSAHSTNGYNVSKGSFAGGASGSFADLGVNSPTVFAGGFSLGGGF